VPIIAKADTMSESETEKFRKKVSQELKRAGIPIYDWILPAIRQVDPKIIAKHDVPPFTLIADRNMEKRVYL